MAEYDEIAALLRENSELRGEFNQLTFDHFELRDKLFAKSEWWSDAGAGSPHGLATAVRQGLAGERASLIDYWYYPSGKHNPYLDILYSDMAAHGMRVRELPEFEVIGDLPTGSTVHLHWIESLRPNGPDEARNLEALDRARAMLRSFVADAANTLIWSVHEPLPHGSLWPEQDAAFHQFLADTAHKIHVLHEATAASCAEYFTLDESKTFVVRLPLYTGVYPNFRTRSNARALLGIADDELCVVFFGALRAYKGLDQLLDAATQVAEQRPLRLLIAGMPVGDIAELIERIDSLEFASAAPLLVPDSEIQTLLGAADVLAVPYQQFLNSAVLMLGLSFGLPVVATENPVTVDARPSGMVTTYRTPDELAAVLGAATVDPTATLNPAFTAAHDPHTIATQFAAAVAKS